LLQTDETGPIPPTGCKSSRGRSKDGHACGARGRPLRGSGQCQRCEKRRVTDYGSRPGGEWNHGPASVPDLVDVTTLSSVLRSLGMNVDRAPDGALSLSVSDEQRCLADYELVRRMRASVCVLGPLLGRRGRACVSLPGDATSAIVRRSASERIEGFGSPDHDRSRICLRKSRSSGWCRHLSGWLVRQHSDRTCNVLCAAVFAKGSPPFRPLPANRKSSTLAAT